MHESVLTHRRSLRWISVHSVVTVAASLGLILAAPPAHAEVPVAGTFPVEGSTASICRDNFGQPRSGGRTHQGNDCMEATGTPLLAVEAGTVRTDNDGAYNCATREGAIAGKTAWLLGDSGTAYYYAHNSENLVADGARVTQGQRIARIGSTGNACSTPHLHFGLYPHGRGTAAIDPHEHLVRWSSGPPPAPPAARRGGPSAFTVSWSEDRLDIFGRGGGGTGYHNYFSRATGTAWPGWEALGGSANLRSVPTVTSWGEGRLDVFALNQDRHMVHWWFDRQGDNRWRGPEVLGNTTFAGPPSAVSWDQGRIDVFARDTNNALRHNWVQSGQTAWPGWETLGSGLLGDPAAVAWSSGRWDVFAVRNDGRMNHWWFDRQGDGRWRGPEELGNTTFIGTPAVASWNHGRIDVFARDTNNALRHNWVQSGQTVWPGWETLASGLNGSPTVITQYNGRLDVFYISSTTKRMHQFYFDRLRDSRWHGPVELGNTTFTNTIDAVTYEPGRIDLFGVDTNQHMRHSWFQQDVTGGFTAWENMNGIFQ